MQHDMRKLINLVESLNEQGDPIVAGKLNGKEIDLDSGVTVTLYEPDNSETDENNIPYVEYKLGMDGEPTEYTAIYYASDKTWLILRDGTDPETGELMGDSLVTLLDQVPDFSGEEAEDDGYTEYDYGLTAAERNR